jgi:hypothetical protein
MLHPKRVEMSLDPAGKSACATLFESELLRSNLR